MKHATEYGLGFCYQQAVGNPIAPVDTVSRRRLLRFLRLRPDTVACSGQPVRGDDFIGSIMLQWRVPDCPECSVLRDAALEGRLLRGTPPAPTAAHGPEAGGGAATQGGE